MWLNVILNTITSAAVLIHLSLFLDLGNLKNKNIEILWASTREAYNFLQAKKLGCHIITVPPNIIEKIENFGKSFSQLTVSTVKNFLIDSKKSKFKLN